MAITLRDLRPVPGKQCVEPVDLVAADAPQDICETGLRVEAIHLGRSGSCHSEAEGCASGEEGAISALPAGSADLSFDGVLQDRDFAGIFLARTRNGPRVILLDTI